MSAIARRFLVCQCGRLGLAVLLAALLAVPALGQTKPSGSVDDELMKELGGNPVDELDRELRGSQPEKPPTPAKPAPGREELDKRLQRELGDAAISEDEDPRLRIARRMHAAGQRLGRDDSGSGTQQIQGEIVADLDKLIAQAKKSCQSGECQNPSTQASVRTAVNQPKAGETKPGSKTGRTAGQAPSQRTSSSPSRHVDPEQINELIKKSWGLLPQRLREQVQQPLGEEFLPKYETLIEDYFRRLSEQSAQ